ncbi:iron ABC transporter permease [Alcanivorax sp. JB21]|uniref:ABC transporter permease n=1 Tax=Alcanivorax limicola TaxID=2874102 RepID=UPI001CBB5588|nr:iron ABC transporter permease [Alcanivorax limicola]MBZ2189162.1 iron ABC transporter permease [Alcanivorax limicola]
MGVLALGRPRRLRRPDALVLLTLALSAMVLMPIAVLALSWLGNESQIWRHLADTVLLDLVLNTLLLVVGVGVGVLVLGVSLAWMVSTLDFPGRRFFDWALLLPLAVPAYVLAFVALDILDFSGPVQSVLRQAIPAFEGGSVRRPWLVVVTLSLVFYPYVYMLARAAFMVQGRALMDQARILGLGPYAAFWRVALPMARPAIAAGLALALMETLADFGAVAVFNYDTFTTAIYKSWYHLRNLNAAAQLASLLLLFVLVTLVLERMGRGRARFEQQQGAHRPHRVRPGSVQRWLLTGYASVIFLAAFAIPVGRLLFWVVDSAWLDLDSRYWGLVTRTLLLATGAALATVTLALLLGYVRRTRIHRMVHAAVRGATVGYAMPGSVLAVGIMLSFAAVDHWLGSTFGLRPVLMGGLLALMVAYVVRFLAVAYGPVESSFERVRPRLIDAARTLGATPAEAVRRIYLPLLTPGVLTALLLVLIDVMKEMPATLLLRPFGWDTLAVRVYEMTTEGEWARAALPSLTLVLVGLLPVYLLMRRTRAH